MLLAALANKLTQSALFSTGSKAAGKYARKANT
jgi:hypothetical protein